MLNILYSEFIKLKKSYILIITLISGLIMPGIIFVSNILESVWKVVSEADKIRFFESNVIDIERMSALFVYTIIFSLIPAYIFSREYTDKTASNIYTYPFSREKIFICKLITTYVLIIWVYLIQIICTYLGGYLIWGTFPSAKFINADIKVNLYSMLLQILLIPIPVLIANITENIIFSIVYGIFGDVVVGIFLAEGAKIYSQFCPLTLPALPFYHYHNGDPIDFVITSGSAIVTFILFMFLCIYHYSNTDID